MLAEVADRVARIGNRRVRVAIDGLTAAGKTTFGHELAVVLAAQGRVGEELPANHAQLRALASGHSVSGERTVARRNGSRIRVVTFTRPVFDDFGQVKALETGGITVSKRSSAFQEHRCHESVDAGAFQSSATSASSRK